MIDKTFLIAPGIGPKKEMAIWASGVRTWRDFLNSDEVCGIKGDRKKRCDAYIEEACRFLENDDSAGLCDLLKNKEEWRLYRKFCKKAAYLDIETDGLDRDSLVTVVTVHRPGKTVTLTHGIDLDAEALTEALKGAKLLVTFNGKCFDIPVLKNGFPNVDFEIPHFDLRFACKKVGLCGGLKNIERNVGISRDDDIEGVDGEEAVRLWKAWERHGDSEALRVLSEYNRADTVNLERLSAIVYDMMVKKYDFPQ